MRAVVATLVLFACSSAEPTPVAVDPADTSNQPDLIQSDGDDATGAEDGTEETQQEVSQPLGVCHGECRTDNDCASGQICALDFFQNRYPVAPYACLPEESGDTIPWTPGTSYFDNNILPDRCSDVVGCPSGQACSASLPGTCIWPCREDNDCITDAPGVYFGQKKSISCVDGLCSPCKPGETCGSTSEGTATTCRLFDSQGSPTCIGTCEQDRDCRALGKICVPPTDP